MKITEDLNPKIEKLIMSTFDLTVDKLPSINEIKPFVHVSDFDMVSSFPSDSFKIRDKYLENCFIVYTDEFLIALKKFCDAKQFTIVNELCCGTGWFSHWMRKYDIPLITATDNKTWGKYKANNKFLPIVKKEDAVKFVNKTPETDMYILSWPYMDPLARMIWDAMRPGQYLLYIGEDWGGCTADESFFQAIEGSEVEDKDFLEVENNFVQFWGLHDRPVLLRKTLKITE